MTGRRRLVLDAAMLLVLPLPILLVALVFGLVVSTARGSDVRYCAHTGCVQQIEQQRASSPTPDTATRR